VQQQPQQTQLPQQPQQQSQLKPGAVINAAGQQPPQGVVAKTPGSPGTTPIQNAAAPVAGNRAAFIIPSERESLPYFRGLVYGEYGAGKTWLWGTSADVPEMRDVVMISAEAGDLTLNDREHAFHLIDPIRVKDYKTIARVYEFLKLHCMLRDSTDSDATARLRKLQNIVMPPKDGVDPETIRLRRYKTVIIDSLSEVEAYCMNQLLGVNDATKMDEEMQGAEWAEYKKQHGMVQRMVRNFRDLPMHVLFTAARAYTQDELKRHIYNPMLTGKLASQVQGFMDVVGYLVMGVASEEQAIAPRRMYIQPGPRFAAKSRFSNYKKAFFDNPTMGSILSEVGLLQRKQVASQGTQSPGAAPANAVKSPTANNTAQAAAQ
jgi:hypothetical protein